MMIATMRKGQVLRRNGTIFSKYLKSDATIDQMTHVRYRVVAFAVALAMITYLDRACISIMAPTIMRDIGIDKMRMSYVFSAFTLAYGLFEIPTAWWADRSGTRTVLA